MTADNIRGGMILVFLIAGSVADIRKRSIPVLLFPLFGITGLWLYLTQGYVTATEEIFGILLGIVFLALARISDGKFGAGDALAILVLGIYLGGSGAAFSALYGMFCASLVSIALLAFRRGTRDTALPFLPFLLTGYLLDNAGGFI